MSIQVIRRETGAILGTYPDSELNPVERAVTENEAGGYTMDDAPNLAVVSIEGKQSAFEQSPSE